MPHETAGAGEILRANRDRILDEWEAHVRTLPGARRLPVPVLRDSIPALLEQIAEALAASDGRREPGRPEAVSHAVERLDIGFDLDQVVAEYGALRSVCLRCLLESGVALRVEDVSILNGALDAAITTAVTIYSRARHRTLQALERITGGDIQHVDALLSRLTQVIRDGLPSVDVVVVLMLTGDRLHTRATAGLEEPAAGEVGEMLAGGVARRVVDDARAIEVTREGGASAELDATRAKALYAVPLAQENAVIGVVCVGSRSAGAFAEEEKRLLSLITDRATQLVAQAQLLINVRAASLAAHALAASQTRSEGLGRLMAAVGESFGWDFGAWWTTDGDTLRNAATWTAPGVTFPAFEAMTRSLALRGGDGLPGRAWVSGKVEWVADMRQHPGFPRVRAAAAEGLFSAMAFPLRHDGQIIAIVEFFSRRRRVAAEEGVQLTRAIAGELGEFVRRIEAQEAVRRSEAEKSAIVRSALDAIVSMDARGLVTEWNPAAERTFGYSAPEALGRPLAELIIPPRLRDAHALGLARYLATGEQQYLDRRLEMPALRRDGSEFLVELVIARLPIEGGVRFTGFLRDLSEQKKAEAERQRLYDEAHENTRQREMLLAVVSHDLRNPLTAIQMSATLLSRAPVAADEALRRKLDVILRASSQMTRLIEDLLDMAAIQARRFSVQPARQELAGIVEEAIELHATQAQARRILLVSNLPGVPLDVDADRHRILQVLSNLLGNALKFCEPGSSVTVSVEATTRDAIVSVADTGPGIDPEALPHVFTPYWSAPAHVRKGTGLGLYISRAIVEAHGGRIQARSTVGAGTTFSFTLPRCEALD